MSKNKRYTRLFTLAFLGFTVSGYAYSGYKSDPNFAYQKRAGWSQVLTLASDDCQTWTKHGKSLIDWSGEACSAEGLIKAINKNPDQIPTFYAAYHEYGSDGVRAIDVKDTSTFNYLNFLYDLSKKLSSTPVISGIYDDYVNDRKAMGLGEVTRDTFVQKLTDISKQKDAIYQQMNEVAKAEYDKNSATRSGEKLGVDYKAVCGPFSIDLTPPDGWARINGAKPESQKISKLGKNGGPDDVKMEWRMATSQPGLWVGMEYIKRDGKAFLNTQMLRASMDAPREFATYDCVKVK